MEGVRGSSVVQPFIYFLLNSNAFIFLAMCSSFIRSDGCAFLNKKLYFFIRIFLSLILLRYHCYQTISSTMSFWLTVQHIITFFSNLLVQSLLLFIVVDAVIITIININIKLNALPPRQKLNLLCPFCIFSFFFSLFFLVV